MKLSEKKVNIKIKTNPSPRGGSSIGKCRENEVP